MGPGEQVLGGRRVFPELLALEAGGGQKCLGPLLGVEVVPGDVGAGHVPGCEGVGISGVPDLGWVVGGDAADHVSCCEARLQVVGGRRDDGGAVGVVDPADGQGSDHVAKRKVGVQLIGEAGDEGVEGLGGAAGERDGGGRVVLGEVPGDRGCGAEDDVGVGS